MKNSKEDRLFYTREYMMNEANRLGFECHDLRRIFAKELLKVKKNQGVGSIEAKREVSHRLGHEDLKTTSIYLK